MDNFMAGNDQQQTNQPNVQTLGRTWIVNYSLILLNDSTPKQKHILQATGPNSRLVILSLKPL